MSKAGRVSRTEAGGVFGRRNTPGLEFDDEFLLDDHFEAYATSIT